MNQDNDQDRATAIDSQVSDQYKSIASEQTPPHLDQAVLREAKRAVRADNRKGSFGAWFRPVAFMASVGLSLAIILELSDSGMFDTEADLPTEYAPRADAPAGASSDTAVRATNQPALSELKRQEKLAPAQALEDQSRDNEAFNAEANNAAQRVQKLEGNAAIQVQAQSATETRVASPQADFAVAPRSLVTPYWFQALFSARPLSKS